MTGMHISWGRVDSPNAKEMAVLFLAVIIIHFAVGIMAKIGWIQKKHRNWTEGIIVVGLLLVGILCSVLSWP